MACLDCNPVFLPGINKIYYAIVNGDSFNYSFTGNSVIIADSETFFQLPVEDDSSEFSQNVIVDSAGEYYEQQFKLIFTDFTSSAIHSLDNKRLVFIFEDVHGNIFISGYDDPLSVSDIQAKLDESTNAISSTIGTRSYSPIRKINKPCWFNDDCCDSAPVITNIVTSPSSWVGSFDGEITVTATGSNLLYKLDKIHTTYRSSSFFSGLSGGTYLVTVREKCVANECKVTQQAIVSQSTTTTLAPFSIRGTLTQDGDYTYTLNSTNEVCNPDATFSKTLNSFNGLDQTGSLISCGANNLTLTYYKDSNGGATVGNLNVIFKRNGTFYGQDIYGPGLFVGGVKLITGLTGGDSVRVDFVETGNTTTTTTTTTTSTTTTTTTVSPAMFTILNAASNDIYINGVTVGGVPLIVDSGTFPVAHGDSVNGFSTTYGVQNIFVSVSVSGTPNNHLTLTAGGNTCTTIDGPGDFVFYGNPINAGSYYVFTMSNGSSC